jgi:hypothetical protein
LEDAFMPPKHTLETMLRGPGVNVLWVASLPHGEI